MMIYVFPYDSPTELKALGEDEKLRELMSKLYSKDKIERRIRDLGSDVLPEKKDSDSVSH